MVIGPEFVFGVVAAALAVLIVNVLVLGPRTTGRSLESVTPAVEGPGPLTEVDLPKGPAR